jgi:hypothetical protein
LLETGITDASAPRGINKVEYYINDELLYTNESYPFNLKQNIGYLENGYHNLKVRACDDVDNCRSHSLTFNLSLDEKQRSKYEINISWITPQKGLAVNSIDFPLDLELKIKNYQYINELNIILSPQTGSSTTLYTINNLTSQKIKKTWSTPPSSGIYTLYARAKWQNFVKETDKIVISVTNPK